MSYKPRFYLVSEAEKQLSREYRDENEWVETRIIHSSQNPETSEIIVYLDNEAGWQEEAPDKVNVEGSDFEITYIIDRTLDPNYLDKKN